MKNRKSVMAVSAILIVFFHLWIYLLGRNQIEMFLRQNAYIGVDMFFFLSAYAISSREVTDYGAFVWSRFKAVYLKFLFFAMVAFLYAGWKWSYLLKVVIGADLLQRGGGAFLWFLPAVMLLYLVLPLYQRLDRRNRPLAVTAALAIWFGVGLAVTCLTKYRAMFIFWNRIPMTLLGFYAPKILNSVTIKIKTWQKAATGIALLAAGSFLLYQWGYRPALQVPLRDMFYVLAIPSALGMIFLADLIPEGKVIKWIGSATLEMYAVQMIFGYNVCSFLVNALMKNTANLFGYGLLINLISFAFVTVLAVLLNQAYGYGRKKLLSSSKRQ